MAQHDYVIDNQSAPAFRADLNSALAAVVSQNSGPSAPTVTSANMLWYDTTNNQLKKRNEADSGWITLGTVDEAGGKFTPNSAITVSEIDPATLVTEADSIASNDNDTTIPTSAAVKAYTDAAISAIPSPNSVLLGTLTTTSGTSHTLSGLDLTPYKFVQFFVNGVSVTETTRDLLLNSYKVLDLTGDSASDRAFGGGVIDLSNGIFYSSGAVYNGSIHQQDTSGGGASGINTASTSITFTCTAGSSFDAGSIRIHGVF